MSALVLAGARLSVVAAKPLVSKLSTTLLGSAFDRQITNACHAAAQTVVGALANQGVSELELAHCVDLMERVIAEQGGEGTDLIAGLVTAEAWIEAARRLDLEPATLPAPLERIVEGLYRQIPVEVARQASLPGSAIFQAHVVQSLIDLAELLEISGINATPPAARPQIEASLYQRLKFGGSTNALDAISTPALLYALLTGPASNSQDVFEEARVGLVDDLCRRLSRTLTTDPDLPQTALYSRDDVKLAQATAVAVGADYVDDILLLTGFLRSRGNTRSQLETLLGDRYLRLELAAHHRLLKTYRIRVTPDGIFDSPTSAT